jgi:hypothetical protein
MPGVSGVQETVSRHWASLRESAEFPISVNEVVAMCGKFRLRCTLSAQSDRFALRLLCVLTRPLCTEREPTMRRYLLSAVLSLSVLLSPLVVAQDASYTFTTIDVPFSGAIGAAPLGINDQGQIVGDYHDSSGQHGFLATPDRRR